MGVDELIRLNLMIGGRSYPVKVEKSETKELKRIEADINSKINEYMVKYPNYNQIDIFTMALLSMIFEINKQGLKFKSIP